MPLYKKQSYSDLHRQAKQSGELFTDPEFPPNAKSLSHTGANSSGITWKRPKDITADARMFVHGVSSLDLVQGELGNCWFVAACSCLAVHKSIWSQVIPNHKDQEFDDDYAGIFMFKFWRFGEWVEVVIDDFLPTRNGRLIYVQSKTKNEFWSALLEKAYAKLMGSYEALNGGELAEALEDFTGGVSETINLVKENYATDIDKRKEFFDLLRTELSHNSLMAAAIPAETPDQMEKETEEGLIKGHAYSVTSIRKVPLAGTGILNLFNREKLEMIRVRNPWGGREWKGAFSDGSQEWSRISKSERDKLGLVFDDDGEFWMTFDDFCSKFKSMAMCRVVNTGLFSLQQRWHEYIVHGEWTMPHRAGGCLNNKSTFLQNPQYLFDVADDDKPQDILFQLIQKGGRDEGHERMTIGFTILKVEENRIYRVHDISKVVVSSAFRNSRSIFLRYPFTRGRFVLVAAVFEPGKVGRFLLRIYKQESSKTVELLLDKPEKSEFPCTCLPVCQYPSCVTRLRVVKAVNLTEFDKNKGLDPYCKVICEGNKVESAVVKNSLNPQFDFEVIFYRKRPAKSPIKIELWNHNIGLDDFIGKQEVLAAQEVKDKTIQLNLKNKKNQQSSILGKVVLMISTSTNLMTL